MQNPCLKRTLLWFKRLFGFLVDLLAVHLPDPKIKTSLVSYGSYSLILLWEDHDQKGTGSKMCVCCIGNESWCGINMSMWKSSEILRTRMNKWLFWDCPLPWDKWDIHLQRVRLLFLVCVVFLVPPTGWTLKKKKWVSPWERFAFSIKENRFALSNLKKGCSQGHWQ